MPLGIEPCCQIIKHKIPHRTSFQCLYNYISLPGIKQIILHHDVDILSSGIQYQRSQSLIPLHLDGEQLVNDLLPPVTAYEKQRKQEYTAPDNCIPETAEIVIFDQGA